MGANTSDESASKQNKLPNIVLIVSDDHAWTDYSFMGHPHIRTPNLDRLASESMVFKRGYVPSSLCCPSLASLITGLYPHQHGITSNDPPMPPGMIGRKYYDTPQYREGREVMAKQLEAVPTLPGMLGELGYLSLQTGKWWQGSFKRGGFTDGMTRGERYGDDGIQIGRRTMQPIYDFIQKARQENQPFMVWYAPMMPHQLHNPPQRILKNYNKVAPNIHEAKYWGMVEWFDETVGQLLKYLDDHDLADNTIVIYVADNGWITDPNTGEATSRSKLSQYDGGVRTPIMIRWPEKLKPQMREELAISLDIVPTLLAAVGEQAKPDMQGINLLDEKALQERHTIFGECFTHESQSATDPAASIRWRWAVDGDWKLILPDQHNEPNSPVELYNLSEDPHEKHNLAEANPEKVEQLRQQIDSWWKAERTKTE